MAYTKLHLTELNEFLVTEILKHKSPVEVNIKDGTTDGFIDIEVNKSEKLFNGKILDFDLQSCECSGLNEHDDLSDYHGKKVHASSAYEFVEYLTGSCDNSQLLINVEDGSWVISLLNFS